MVCIPCIVVPVFLFIWHRYLQPIFLRFWNPFRKVEPGAQEKSDKQDSDTSVSNGSCPFSSGEKEKSDKQDSDTSVSNGSCPFSSVGKDKRDPITAKSTSTIEPDPDKKND